MLPGTRRLLRARVGKKKERKGKKEIERGGREKRENRERKWAGSILGVGSIACGHGAGKVRARMWAGCGQDAGRIRAKM